MTYLVFGKVIMDNRGGLLLDQQTSTAVRWKDELNNRLKKLNKAKC